LVARGLIRRTGGMDMDSTFLAVNLSSIIVAGLILLAGFAH
jgi:hypothetical protein